MRLARLLRYGMPNPVSDDKARPHGVRIRAAPAAARPALSSGLQGTARRREAFHAAWAGLSSGKG
jgi:hypothetical protein